MLDCRSVTRRATPFVLLVAAAVPPAAHADFLEWKRGDFKVKGAGYIQGDLRGFPGWEVAADDPTLREDRADVRRFRAGIEIEKDVWSGEVIFDANELLNSVIGPDDSGTAFSFRRDLRNGYVERALGKDHFVRVGHFKVPISREFLTSAANTDLAERSLLANGLGAGRDWGVMAGGTIEVARELRYLVGAFAGDGWAEDTRGNFTGAGRLVLEAAKGFELAVSASLGSVDADVEDPVVEPQPKSLRGKSASGWSFFRRAHVEGQRRRVGADVLWTRGPLTFKAEVLHGREERKGQGATFDDLPAVAGLGWSASAVWRIRGAGAKKGEGPTPVDLAVRYESLRFDDEGPDEGFAGIDNRAPNIRPQVGQALSGGVSYRPFVWARLLGNVVVERYNDGLLAPEIGRKGNYVTLFARLQLQVP